MKNLQVLRPPEEAENHELVQPSGSGYVFLAAEIESHPPFLWTSPAKRRLIEDISRWCQRIAREPGVVEAVAFKAILMPPRKARRARFDLAVLIETESVARAEALRADGQFQLLEAHVRDDAGQVYAVAASNAKRIGAVDHRRDGVFLFNYFYADSLAQNLAAWEYNRGWLQNKTGLDNATVLAPTHPELAQYTLINHCRWDRARDVLPALIFKRRSFDANDTAPMPVLYTLAG